MIHEKPVCVIEICKGYCCEHLSKIVTTMLKIYGLSFELNDDNSFRCNSHHKETGLCMQYHKRPSYCKWFYCPSATRGFMRQAKESMEMN